MIPDGLPSFHPPRFAQYLTTEIRNCFKKLTIVNPGREQQQV